MLFGRSYFVAVHTLARPGERLVASVRFRGYLYFLCHHKRGVKAHAELADKLGFFLFGILESKRAGLGDCAQIFFQFFFGHADTVILDDKRALFLIRNKLNPEIGCRVSVGKRLKMHLIYSVACIGNKLAQENFAIGVYRIYHEFENSFRLCFELFHNFGLHTFFRNIL